MSIITKMDVSENDLKWEGRVIINWNSVNASDINVGVRLKVLSYNIFADSKCVNVRYTNSKTWDVRKVTLLREIISYNADIICLQDVDHFGEWWQPQLMLAGYDAVWKKRTNEAHDPYEGVAIAYRREYFMLFKTIEIELNNTWEIEIEASENKGKFRTDDVGLILFLQPKPSNPTKSALCIGCCMFDDNETDSSVRLLQSQYFNHCIEVNNRDYQLPVVLGVSLHDGPDSHSYHVFRTGRKPVMPKAPKKCNTPWATPFCRGSAVVNWIPPQQDPEDPVILTYRIAWRPGGNQPLGFRTTADVDSGDCIQYETKKDAKGVRRTTALEARRFVIVGLSSGVTYEFKIQAINDVGEGPWSEISAPIVLPTPPKAPPMPQLQYLKDLESVQVFRETSGLAANDIDAEAAATDRVMYAATQTTPRTIDGKVDRQISVSRVLPPSTTSREGWQLKLGGQIPKTLISDLTDRSSWHLNHVKVLRQSVLRSTDGTFKDTVSATKSGKVAVGTETVIAADDSVTVASTGSKAKSVGSRSVLKHTVVPSKHKSVSLTGEDGTESVSTSGVRVGSVVSAEMPPSINDLSSKSMSFYGSTRELQTLPSFYRGASTVGASTIDSESDEDSDWGDSLDGDGQVEETAEEVVEVAPTEPPLGEEGNRAREVDDDVILDCVEAVRHIGLPNRRDVHSLGLRSAYEGYCAGGEMPFTQSRPSGYFIEGVRCTDFIFFSALSIRPVKLLSMPLLNSLSGDDPGEPIVRADPYYTVTPLLFDKYFDRQSSFIDAPSADNAFSRDNSSQSQSEERPRGAPPFRTEVDEIKNQLRDSLTGISTASSLLWAGAWAPFASSNPRRRSFWLPNESYASSHLALYFEFSLVEDHLPSELKK